MNSEHKQLGHLEKVELRTIWDNEATDFTPWLAREDNLKLLGETIGIELELVAQEKSVGPFRADILCRDIESDDDKFVLIENQLERTNHTHLGQILTYAAGLNAVTICWLADRFTDEHRAAVDWLNEITDERFNFFGLEIELWKIGDSLVAPKFNLASKPNTWSKTLRGGGGGGGGGDTSDDQKLKLEFWTGFRKHFAAEHPDVHMGTRTYPRGVSFPQGKSGVRIHSRAFLKNPRMHVGFLLGGPHAPSRFEYLLERKEEIDSQLGEPTVWTKGQTGNTKHIRIERPIDGLSNKEKWPEHYEWLTERVIRFHKVFVPLIPNLDEGVTQEEEDEVEVAEE